MRIEANAPTTRPRKLRQHSPVLVVVFIILAAVLRTMNLELMEFRFDSAYWSLAALDIIEGKGFPLIGQQVGSVTVPLYNGPVLSYLVALIFRLGGPSPTHPALIIGLLGATGVGVCFWLGRRLYSESIGLMAAVLMACAPWMVLFTRMLWPHSLFPFVIPITAGLLYCGSERESPWQILVWGVLIGICIQLHLSALALVPAGVLFLLIFFRHIRAFIAAGFGLAIGYAPILIYDVFHDWTNIRALARLGGIRIEQADKGLVRIVKYLWNFENLISGQGLWWSRLAWRQSYLPFWVEWGQGLILSGLFAVALGLLFWTFMRGRLSRPRIAGERLATKADVLCLLYTGVPMGYILVSGGPVLRHYFILVLPTAFLLMARGLHLIQGRMRSWSWIGVCVGVTLNLITSISMLTYLAQARSGWEHGTVLEDKAQTVEWIIKHSGKQFVVDASRSREALAYYFLFRRELPVTFDASEGIISSTGAGDVSPSCIIVEPQFYELPSTALHKPMVSIGGVCIVQMRPDCRFNEAVMHDNR